MCFIYLNLKLDNFLSYNLLITRMLFAACLQGRKLRFIYMYMYVYILSGGTRKDAHHIAVTPEM